MADLDATLKAIEKREWEIQNAQFLALVELKGMIKGELSFEKYKFTAKHWRFFVQTPQLNISAAQIVPTIMEAVREYNDASPKTKEIVHVKCEDMPDSYVNGKGRIRCTAIRVPRNGAVVVMPPAVAAFMGVSAPPMGTPAPEGDDKNVPDAIVVSRPT